MSNVAAKNILAVLLASSVAKEKACEKSIPRQKSSESWLETHLKRSCTILFFAMNHSVLSLKTSFDRGKFSSKNYPRSLVSIFSSYRISLRKIHSWTGIIVVTHLKRSCSVFFSSQSTTPIGSVIGNIFCPRVCHIFFQLATTAVQEMI